MKNKATSNIKSHQVFPSLSFNDVGTSLRDGPFSSDKGIVNLHPLKRIQWIAYINEIYFDLRGCSPPKKVSKFDIKRNGYCFCFEYKKQNLKFD